MFRMPLPEMQPMLASEYLGSADAYAFEPPPDADLPDRSTRGRWHRPPVVGCEHGGAMKNVIALAAGMADGLGFGDTPRPP